MSCQNSIPSSSLKVNVIVRQQTEVEDIQNHTKNISLVEIPTVSDLVNRKSRPRI